MLQVCLNGIRKKDENESIPYLKKELSEELTSLKKAGIFNYHIHPKSPAGKDTLEKYYTEQS